MPVKIFKIDNIKKWVAQKIQNIDSKLNLSVVYSQVFDNIEAEIKEDI